MTGSLGHFVANLLQRVESADREFVSLLPVHVSSETGVSTSGNDVRQLYQSAGCERVRPPPARGDVRVRCRVGEPKRLNPPHKLFHNSLSYTEPLYKHRITDNL